MAKKLISNIPLDKQWFLMELKSRNLSIKSLGADPAFGYSEKSVRRALKAGKASINLTACILAYFSHHKHFILKSGVKACWAYSLMEQLQQRNESYTTRYQEETE